jgi:hypothetical protein
VTGFNPFVVPGLEENPDQPLCPWQDDLRHHEEYYAGIGGQYEAFEQFKRRLRHPDQLARASRIVIATGPELSGKTSLANRCVHWVVAGLDPDTTRCHIYALREVCPRRATVEDRIEKVCRRLVDRLRELDIGSGGRLSSNVLSAHDVLPLLGRFHQSSIGKLAHFFVILLPSLEPDTAEAEIEEYRAALAGVSGVLCVTENPADVPLPAYRGETPPLSLSLRYLQPGESHMLVAGWPSAPREGDGLRTIREKELNELEELLGTMNANITLGKLLTALRKLYANPRDVDDHTQGKLPYVGFLELVKAYLGEWFRQNPQGSA